ncbi:hypothetical protein OUZ56_003254 [Daphnia magna]|uniref:Uncharacterized protein n=1 Tax=Daphnia magna TaxID=35525 RepID=A0ABR0A875_9CRUS|nr:hypothetical protein OUZ56_003254 [Daphnia magna]
MRLYVSTLKPTDSLRRLAFIVMYVYAPSWFHIKCHPKLQDAARNFHNLIKLSSILRLNEKCISMDVSEPPLTFAFTNNQIRSAIKTGEILSLGDFPNNTQAVERTVKLVTEASSKFQTKFSHETSSATIPQFSVFFRYSKTK